VRNLYAWYLYLINLGIVKTGIIGPHTRRLLLPLLVRSVFFLFICLTWGLKGNIFAVFSPLQPKARDSGRLGARSNYSMVPDVLTVRQMTWNGGRLRMKKYADTVCSIPAKFRVFPMIVEPRNVSKITQWRWELNLVTLFELVAECQGEARSKLFGARLRRPEP